MAGDWIKMRHDLATDPAVIATAERLGITEPHVVGLLHRLWVWADQHTEDGNAVGVTLSWIERYVGVTGFTEMLVRVGWIEPVEDGIRIINFDRHMGKSAKKRALTAERVKRSRNAASVTEALPEKRREEKNKKHTRAERASRRVPADFVLTDDLRAFATGRGIDVKAVEEEFAKFRDHQFRDGHSDWSAAWRNWVRRIPEQPPTVGRVAANRGGSAPTTAAARSMHNVGVAFQGKPT